MNRNLHQFGGGTQEKQFIPGSSKCVKFVPFHPKNLPKNINFTYREDPGICDSSFFLVHPTGFFWRTTVGTHMPYLSILQDYQKRVQEVPAGLRRRPVWGRVSGEPLPASMENGWVAGWKTSNFGFLVWGHPNFGLVIFRGGYSLIHSLASLQGGFTRLPRKGCWWPKNQGCSVIST